MSTACWLPVACAPREATAWKWLQFRRLRARQGCAPKWFAQLGPGCKYDGAQDSRLIVLSRERRTSGKEIEDDVGNATPEGNRRDRGRENAT
ncbi:4-hydroxybenzoate transporter [Anopheles sinensis]|uniref:4-hydroxybenzoate transporter n=1 Tax=Anopheles sinensis TaxID=74873 RepID=A0A084W345_ANOSI|nr:4-hydroxybenzoate transporter [Anopheles sinensis]